MRYLVLAFLCLVAVIAYVQRVGLNSANRPIQRDLELRTDEFGAIGSAFLIGYAFLQLPAGWLADRWGSRNALALFAVLWSIVTGLIGLSQGLWSVLALWTLMGMAQAGVFPCAAKMIGQWFPDTQKAMASGFLGSSTMLGTAAASYLTAFLLTKVEWTWQFIYVLYGAAGVMWAAAFWMSIPEHEKAQRRVPPMTRADWGRLVGSAPMWLLCGQQFFRAGAMIFFINWFPKFLRESRSLSELEAGVLTTWANCGALAGGICGGFFSDWMLRRTGWRRGSRQGIAVVGLSSCAVLVISTYFVEDVVLATALFTTGAFLAAFGGVSGYTVAIEFGGTRVATVFSTMNMCGNFGAALFAYLAGVVVERTGSWDPALFMFAAIFVVDATCWALLNPRRPLFEDAPSERR